MPDASTNGLLVIEITGDGSVRVGVPTNMTCDSTLPSCSYLVPIGTTVTLKQTADQDWQFAAWSGCTASADDCVIVIPPGTTVITATFVPN
ncbi:MAG: hypothetical protein H0V17_32415 [Deltaproteobacteria bacterium]|nr:hypothetical protein [Deltaproteobacteria bacterium]